MQCIGVDLETPALGAFEVDIRERPSPTQLLSKLTFKELSELHDSGTTPDSTPLGLLEGRKLNSFRSRSLAQALDKFYDGDWVFESPTCDNKTRTLGYLLIRGRRIALATWDRLEAPEEDWKRGIYVDFSNAIKIRCDDSPPIVNPMPFNMIVDVWRVLPEFHNIWLAKSYIVLNKR